MNIIYDNTIFSIQKYGGISRYFSELIKRIAGYDDVTPELYKGLNILPRRFFRFHEGFLDHKLLRCKYDIYHPTYYSSIVKKRKGIKTVVTVYDMIHELYADRFKILDKDIEIKKRSILNADHVICISGNTKHDLMNIYDIKDDRISVIYLGFSLNDCDSSPLIFNRPQKPYILYVGLRNYYKNFNILLNAFNILNLKKDFDLVCFGGGGFLKEEMLEFKRLKLESSIRHIEGHDELLRAYYKSADIFVCTSLYEGFGLPVLEAISNDCMVITSNAGSIPEIAGNAAMFFSPDKVDELCSCIKQVISDNRIREEYRKKGRERIKIFSWDKTTQETYNVYKKVLNGKIRE